MGVMLLRPAFARDYSRELWRGPAEAAFGREGGNGVCFVLGMATTNKLKSYAGRKLARRLTRSVPYIGAAIALVTLGSAIRQKGLVRGAIHSALDAIPFVGGAKNLAEAARGRDFLRDRVRPSPSPAVR